jgi:hypothetical protein
MKIRKLEVPKRPGRRMPKKSELRQNLGSKVPALVDPLQALENRMALIEGRAPRKVVRCKDGTVRKFKRSDAKESLAKRKAPRRDLDADLKNELDSELAKVKEWESSLPLRVKAFPIPMAKKVSTTLELSREAGYRVVRCGNGVIRRYKIRP